MIENKMSEIQLQVSGSRANRSPSKNGQRQLLAAPSYGDPYSISFHKKIEFHNKKARSSQAPPPRTVENRKQSKLSGLLNSSLLSSDYAAPPGTANANSSRINKLGPVEEAERRDKTLQQERLPSSNHQ